MSSFTGEIILKKIGERLWEVYTPFEYHVGDENSNDIIKIEKGTPTDFASVPRAFWTIFPPDGEYTAASIVHDDLYRKQSRTRKESDSIFIEAMKVLGVPLWTRWTMWAAVRAFGWIPYGRYADVLRKKVEKFNP